MIPSNFFIIIMILIQNQVQCEDSTLCTEEFCKNYPGQDDLPCPPVSSYCNKSNSNSGIYLKSPTPCNCCEFCIGYLREGDSCSTGEKTSDSPSEICGPGLYCDADKEKCRKMDETPCTEAQIKFDEDKANGKTGDFQLRPDCDEHGDYVPFHCIPGEICYCVDKNGERIFGTVDNDGKASLNLHCSCSRNHRELSNIIGRNLNSGEFMRCTDSGAYDVLQCIDEETCICVDELDGAPTYDQVAPVQIWAISDETLPCFNRSKNTEGEFYKRCEEIFINQTRDIDDKKENYDLVLSYELPKCDLNGNYAPVQENHKYKFCATPQGFPIEKYMLEKNSTNEELINSMNCKCAMAKHIMSTKEKPSCLENGNYNPIQTRRGVSYKVDEDGNQIV